MRCVWGLLFSSCILMLRSERHRRPVSLFITSGAKLSSHFYFQLQVTIQMCDMLINSKLPKMDFVIREGTTSVKKRTNFTDMFTCCHMTYKWHYGISIGAVKPMKLWRTTPCLLIFLYPLWVIHWLPNQYIDLIIDTHPCLVADAVCCRLCTYSTLIPTAYFLVFVLQKGWQLGWTSSKVWWNFQVDWIPNCRCLLT